MKIANDKKACLSAAFEHGIRVCIGTKSDEIEALLNASGCHIEEGVRLAFKWFDTYTLLDVWGGSNYNLDHPYIVIGDRLNKGWNDEMFAVFMHEMGHVMLHTKNELAAWAWAMVNAEVWTAPMRRCMNIALDTYGIDLNLEALETEEAA